LPQQRDVDIKPSPVERLAQPVGFGRGRSAARAAIEQDRDAA
jgi:hypothetical protein